MTPNDAFMADYPGGGFGDPFLRDPELVREDVQHLGSGFLDERVELLQECRV